jgi:hypothetical protein
MLPELTNQTISPTETSRARSPTSHRIFRDFLGEPWPDAPGAGTFAATSANQLGESPISTVVVGRQIGLCAHCNGGRICRIGKFLFDQEDATKIDRNSYNG